MDEEYVQWIAELARRYRSSQIKSSIKVNEEILHFYWSVGEDIEKRKLENRYGSHFYENVSKDLRQTLGLTRGLSPTTIKYAHSFYRLYSQLLENRQGIIDDFECIFMIPWSLQILIIDKVKKDPRKALFYVKQTIENNWGYGVLLNFLSTDLYERQGAAQTNFAFTLPAPESDLAQELLKSPYDFSFLPGQKKYQEAELKSARYALSSINRPLGISEYEMARQSLPDDLKNALPSPEEIEIGLMGK